jgi:hypothetical protein
MSFDRTYLFDCMSWWVVNLRPELRNPELTLLVQVSAATRNCKAKATISICPHSCPILELSDRTLSMSVVMVTYTVGKWVVKLSTSLLCHIRQD